ncbi:AfsR/SARP family transcriptional regulator [Dactylosporangium salmoneum]|uniref:AfsR/SARP family transcriptional regulator n=1 Tax=Dactylosporangium salmoneum TaxID=53361 RepID=UPI0031E1F98D
MGRAAPPAAVAALQSYVSHLRRRLEPDRGARSRGSVIVSRGSGYAVLLEPEAVDAWRFERLLREPGPDPIARLGEALALWRGPAYAEYADLPWAEAEASRLNELREVARDQLAAARLAGGESAVLVPELETLVAAAPLREERWRLLVLALYRAHRQGDALAALRRARRMLADALRRRGPSARHPRGGPARPAVPGGDAVGDRAPDPGPASGRGGRAGDRRDAVPDPALGPRRPGVDAHPPGPGLLSVSPARRPTPAPRTPGSAARR